MPVLYLHPPVTAKSRSHRIWRFVVGRGLFSIPPGTVYVTVPKLADQTEVTVPAPESITVQRAKVSHLPPKLPAKKLMSEQKGPCSGNGSTETLRFYGLFLPSLRYLPPRSPLRHKRNADPKRPAFLSLFPSVLLRHPNRVHHFVHIALHFSAFGVIDRGLLHHDIGHNKGHPVIAESVTINRAI